MTLIAAFTRDTTTFLLGDVRLTTTHGRQANPGRKVHILRPTLAVGWTGFRGGAETIIKHLRERLPATPTWENIVYHLTLSSPSIPTAARVTIIGAWRTAGDLRVFRWRSDSPRDVTTSDKYSAGSGAPLADLLISHPVTDVGSLNGTPNPVEAALSIVGHLAAIDFWDSSGEERGFGFAYEVVMSTGASFQYLHRVRYVGAKVQFDAQGRVARTPTITSGLLSVDSNQDRVLIERWMSHDEPSDRALLIDIDRPDSNRDFRAERQQRSGLKLTTTPHVLFS